MTKRTQMGWTAAAALALALIATRSSWACEQHAEAAEAKDPKAVAAGGETAGCDKPCCAKKSAADAKSVAAPAPAANAANAIPCDGAKSADGKSCPKKAAMVAKVEPTKDAPKAEPTPNAGANR